MLETDWVDIKSFYHEIYWIYVLENVWGAFDKERFEKVFGSLNDWISKENFLKLYIDYELRME